MEEVLRDLGDGKLVNLSEYLHEPSQAEAAAQAPRFTATTTYAIRGSWASSLRCAAIRGQAGGGLTGQPAPFSESRIWLP